MLITQVFRLGLLVCLSVVLQAGPAPAQPDFALEIQGLTVARNGQVMVDYALRNQTGARLCVATGGDRQPLVHVQPYRAKDDAALRPSDTPVSRADEWFRGRYRVLEPDTSLRGRIRLSVYDYSEPVEQTGQAFSPPRLWQDYLYLILALPVRNCPLVALGPEISFNRGFFKDPVVSSLPSRLFSLSRPGRY